MEQLTAALPGFEELPGAREGFEMTFRGHVPNAEGEPDGEFVQAVLIVPPLNFHSMRRIQARQKARSAASTPEEIQEDAIETIWMSLKRNYKGVPRWLVEQSLDGPLLVKFSAKMREMAGIVQEKKAETAP